MELKQVNLGSSLLVPSVQELAQGPLTTLPPRYVHPDQDPPMTSHNTPSLLQVPVIDMQSLPSGDFVDSELQKLHHACKDWGFFQLINHGVNSSLVEKVKLEVQEFFKLPMEEKKKFWQQPGDMEGFGQAFVVSEEQKLDWADVFNMITLPAHLRKPHLLPKFPLPFRDSLEVYFAELKNLAMKMLERIAKAIKMEVDDMKELFEEGFQAVRMNYYPPCPEPKLAIGLSPHSDAAALTILLQVNDIEGLQIRKDEMWVPIIPLPNALIVNIGDVLEIVTNGAYRSIEHRATVNSVKERLSIATFLSPKLDGDLGPALSLITPETPALFKRVNVADYYKGYLSRELHGKSYLDVMRIQNEEGQNN